MSYMTTLRKVDLSIFHHIKDLILKPFIEHEEYVPLNYEESLSTDTTFIYAPDFSYMIPNPVALGRGWVYFDDDFESTLLSGTPEQDNRVHLYYEDPIDPSGFSTIAGTEYMVDYVNGRIVTSGTCAPTHVSYYWNYISVVDEWRNVATAGAPAVVVDLYETSKHGFQLGGGNKPIRKVNLHVFATSAAERNDMVEVIYDGLFRKSCPIYEFPHGTVLDYDGTFYDRRNNPNKLTSLFDRSVVPGMTYLQFEDVKARNVSLPAMNTGYYGVGDQTSLDGLNAYRARISFDMVSYVEPT